MNTNTFFLDPRIIAAFDKQFIGEVPDKKKKIVRIKWRGRYITAASGKTIWTSIGAAKNAFRRCYNFHEIDRAFEMVYPDTRSYPWNDPRWSEMLKELEKSGLLEYEVREE